MPRPSGMSKYSPKAVVMVSCFMNLITGGRALFILPLLTWYIISDLNKAWEEAKPYASAVRNFVASGGNYLGFCLGAFLIGSSPGFGLLPLGVNVVREIRQDGAEIDDDSNAIIKIDWASSTGPKRGTTEHHRRLFFQDGAAFTLANHSPATVLGRYSSNNDVAAMLSPFGKGWVADIGPHPEADQSWCKDHDSLMEKMER
jgi:hypothetical protein